MMLVDTSDANLPIVQFGEFRMDLHLRCVFRDSNKLKIGAMSFNALEFLVRNRHRVVSKTELLQSVWGGQRTKGTVEQAISQLRRVFRDDAAKASYIETVPGHGYRFIAEVLAPVPDGNSDFQDSSVADSDDIAVQRSSGDNAAAVDSLSAGRRFLLRSSRRVSVLVACGVFVFCGVAIRVIAHFREPLEIANVVTNGNSLIAKGVTGDALWAYRFDAALKDRLPQESNWRTQVVDLDGDGNSEVLFAGSFANPPQEFGREEIFCFSSRGKLLWRYRPEIQMEFNTRDLNGPWRISQMLVIDGQPKSIWVAMR